MRRFAVSARRPLGLALAIVAGAAVLAVATPANATDTNAEHLTVAHSDQCLADGQRKVTWTVTNSRPDATILTTVMLTSVPAGFGFANGSGVTVGATLPASPASVTGVQLLPATAVSASLQVGVLFDKGISITGTGTVVFEGTCTPQYTVTQDCHGITFTFKAPPAGYEGKGTDVSLNPSVGTEESFIIKPGDADKIVTFPGTTGLTIDLEYGDFEARHAWAHDPCPSPSASPSPSARPSVSPSPSLPVTGSSLTGVIGIGAGLLVGGVALIALFLVLRRRRSVTSA